MEITAMHIPTPEERLKKAKLLSQNCKYTATKSELNTMISIAGTSISEAEKPIYAEAYCLRGDMERILGNSDRAVTDYAKAIELYKATPEKNEEKIDHIKSACKAIIRKK